MANSLEQSASSVRTMVERGNLRGAADEAITELRRPLQGEVKDASIQTRVDSSANGDKQPVY
jgi:hypothetical protein